MSAVVSEPVPSLRVMRGTDLPAVLAVERTVYEFPWTDGIFRDCLRVGYVCLVYDGPAGIAGYGVMSVAVGECHLLNLSIHPDYQGQGLGSHLITQLLDLARHHKARMAFLEVRESNQKAQRLYANLGFNEIGMRHNYYPARQGREDAIILARML